MTENTTPDHAGAEATEGHDDDALALAHTLFQAARDGSDELLGAYLDAGVPATMTNAAGDSLLMLAAFNGHWRIGRDSAAYRGLAHQLVKTGKYLFRDKQDECVKVVMRPW